MKRRRRGVRGVVRVLFLVALLLVPVALGGHGHADHDATRPCAVCLAAHHTPGAVTPALHLAASFIGSIAAPAAPERVPLRSLRSPHIGRAPPLVTV